MIGAKVISGFRRHRTARSEPDKAGRPELLGIPLGPAMRRATAALIAGVACSVIAQMLSKKAEPRPTMREVKERLDALRAID